MVHSRPSPQRTASDSVRSFGAPRPGHGGGASGGGGGGGGGKKKEEAAAPKAKKGAKGAAAAAAAPAKRQVEMLQRAGRALTKL